MFSSQDGPSSLAEVLKNVEYIKRIAFDIGQTVVKIAYTSTAAKGFTTNEKKLIHNHRQVLHLHCIQVRLDDFEKVIDYIAENGNIACKEATFSCMSGIRELEAVLKKKLGLELHRINQMDSLVRGTNFLIRNIESESFTYHHHNDDCRYKFKTFRPSMICPYLVVNVGTGISIFRVDSDDRYERIGGSSLGGGAFFGISQLITDDAYFDLDELLKMAEDGDHRHIDTLVSDIYGQNYETLGLSGDMIAGSFGKCTKRNTANEIMQDPKMKKNAVRSLLLMISNSVGQLSYLYAARENVHRIYFDGFLIRNHPIIMRTIAYAVRFWSQGKQEAHFLRHEGYSTALGAFMRGGLFVDSTPENFGAADEATKLSWHEYYTGCSDLGRFVPTDPLSAGFQANVLELECSDLVLRPFPLLAERLVEYEPDVVDLSSDQQDRDFWLNIIEGSADTVMKKALESQANSPTAAERAAIFKEKLLKQVNKIRDKSFTYGSCTVRNLLDLREQLLNEQEFDDSFLTQKTLENNISLEQLQDVLGTIDMIVDDDARLLLVSKGLLAGNVFDWGAKKVIEMIESEEGLSFSKAIDTIPARPWLIDNYYEFLQTMRTKTYKCAAIFVDNSGADYILGVIPFARELLKRGSKVIIVSNLNPALNDLTYREMMDLVPRLCNLDDSLKEAVESQRLLFHHSGQGSPCLDLRKVNSVLNRAVRDQEVDFVVIEGMGRALHTNLNAHFSCDSLKAAVIKSTWLAEKMGGELFSVVFKFEHAKNLA